MKPLEGLVKITQVKSDTKFVALWFPDDSHAGYPVSWFIYYCFILVHSFATTSAQLICQFSSLFPPSLQLVSSMPRAVLVVCFYALLDVVLQEGIQVCQRHLHILPIFSSWKVDPHLFFFLVSLCNVCHHLLVHCLHSG